MSQPYIGEIRMFGSNFPPAGWAFCQGQLLSIANNQALFALIGTTYGGDGQTTFALPNLQSRFPMHQGNSFVIGQSGGSETVALTANTIPAHSHLPRANSVAGSDNPNGNVWAKTTTGKPYVNTAGGVPAALNAATVQNQGGSQPHDNMHPYLCINFSISLFGIFPSP